MDRFMEDTILSALSEYNGFVRHTWSTKLNKCGMVVYDDVEPICYLTMDEWDEFLSKYETNLIKSSVTTYRFRTADEIKQGGF